MKGATVRDIVAPASLHVEADARIRLTRPPFKWARTEVRSLCCPRRLLALVASAAEKERAAADSIALHWHSVRASRPTRSLRSIHSERASERAIQQPCRLAQCCRRCCLQRCQTHKVKVAVMKLLQASYLILHFVRLCTMQEPIQVAGKAYSQTIDPIDCATSTRLD